jgi:hypothetical protein
LNRSAFESPAVGTLGNMARNSAYAPGFHTLDLSLVRAFRFNGNHRIEARIESFNAFNWFQWSGDPLRANTAPVNNFNNVDFGRITSAGDPRIMQFAVKYQF